jgi:hypothetical protein
MSRPTDRFRSAKSLIGCASSIGLALAVVAFFTRDCGFLSALLLTICGVAWSLAVIPLVYDAYQRRRRQQIWHKMRRQVARTLAGRIYLLTLTLRWRINPTYYGSYGNQVRAADVNPTSTTAAAHDECIGDILELLGRFAYGFYKRVVIDERTSRNLTGDDLAEILADLLSEELRSSLRGELMLMAPIAEEASDLAVAVEELLAIAVWIREYAIAARAVETGDTEFMTYLRRFVMQLKIVYARAAEEFIDA